jgi:hypothetical protein
MPRSGWLTAFYLVATAGVAAAHPVLPDDYVERPIVIAGDAPPPQPEPEPYVEPPPPPRQASIGLALGGMTYASDTMTPLETFGPSGGMGIVHIAHREEPGFEALVGATGSERGRSYSLTVRLLIGAKLERKNLARPFLAIGPAFAIARLAQTDDKSSGAGMGIGPSGAIGLHGFLSHRVYWRASAGFVGAGIGTFSTDLGLGWVIDK